VASPNRINLALLSEFLMEIGSACGDDWPFDVVVAGQVKDMVKDLPRNQQQLFQKSKVRMLGFVPDIGEFYSTVDLIVSPVTMGTGINVKTVQAMAYGMPLLTTKVGIKGVETDEPLHNHDTVRDLVQSLLALSDSPSELERLAEISVVRYRALLVAADSSFQDIFNHPKLISELPR
jgi:glycosyltransferase involved in cell wall biosynthesis